MIGFLVAAAATAAALITAALIVRRPPPRVHLSDSGSAGSSLNRWANFLGQTAQECKKALDLPPVPEYQNVSHWNLGAPVQPVDFSRQLASLQSALAPAKAPQRKDPQLQGHELPQKATPVISHAA
jgi:predicted secreted hydrolase